MTLRLILVDDHPVVRAGLTTLLATAADLAVIGEAATGREALALVDTIQPDILIVDMALPDLNGIQVAAAVLQQYPEVKVLALSAYEDLGYLRALLRAGGSGYVLKRAAAATLIQAIRTVASGGVYLDASLAAAMSVPTADDPAAVPATDTLSAREAAVVHLIAQGYTNKEVAAQLNLSVKTVETYKTRAMDKLALHSRVDLVRYALQMGWLLTP